MILAIFLWTKINMRKILIFSVATLLFSSLFLTITKHLQTQLRKSWMFWTSYWTKTRLILTRDLKNLNAMMAKSQHTSTLEVLWVLKIIFLRLLLSSFLTWKVCLTCPFHCSSLVKSIFMRLLIQTGFCSIFISLILKLTGQHLIVLNLTSDLSC